MENENKRNKVLEVILILLVALSFVLIPLLNQYRQKSLSFNNTQLVNKQNSRNGTIDINEYGFGDIKTISCSFIDFDDYTLSLDQSVVDNNLSLTGSNDVFGFGFDNYFRFSPVLFNNNVVSLEYYLEFETGVSKSYKLAYYFKPLILNDGEANYMQFQLVSRTSMINFNVLPDYNILNFSIYNYTSLNTFYDYVNGNVALSNLLFINNNYRYTNNYESVVVNNSLVNFINIDKDFITPLVNSATSESYNHGYNVGYNAGINDANSNSVFSVLQKAASSISSFMNIEVLPNISLWLLISIPLSVSIMIILLRLLRGGS